MNPFRWLASAFAKNLHLRAIIDAQTREIEWLRADKEDAAAARKPAFRGIRRFVKTPEPFDRVIFPHNFKIDSLDPVERREYQELASDIKAVVNGSREYNILSLWDAVKKCECGSPMMHRYLKILRQYHCEDLGGADPILFAKLPEIYNYIFSNGASDVDWNP